MTAAEATRPNGLLSSALTEGPERARPLCIYHGNCADGFAAAWCVWKFFEGRVDLYAGVHGEEPPDVRERWVVIVDFSYKARVVSKMADEAHGVLILDHHKSAIEDLSSICFPNIQSGGLLAPTSWGGFVGNCQQDIIEGVPRMPYAVFDVGRSGVGIAWDFFFLGQPRPKLIDHVEDRDLWRFKLDGTREIQAALFSYPYDMEEWRVLMEGDFTEKLRMDGMAIERKHHKDVKELVEVCRRRMVIAGYTVWVASLPYTLTSDAGHLMAFSEPFAACYWDTADGRVFSLRSVEGGPNEASGLDVSKVAAEYGGGGHRHAAGFRVPRDHELAMA